MFSARAADSISRPRFKALEFIADDKPASAIIDTRYNGFKDKKEFPLSLFITVNTPGKDNNGYPVKKEAEVYNNIEAGILKELNKELISAFIGKTTMNGYGDLIFYIKSSDQQKATHLLTALQKKYPGIKEFIFERDPEWEAVAAFYKAD